MTPRSLIRASVAAAAAIACPAGFANMGNLATNYGVLPSDVGSAQALSLFNGQLSAVYYNPAGLTREKHGELIGALLHGDQVLEASSQGGNGFIGRDSNVLSDTPTQHLLIGMKTNLTDITKFEKPLYLGFMAGVEKYGTEMLAFSSKTSTKGQYFSYGREPLFLNLGGGLELLDGLSIGASARITLHAEATLETNSNLSGDTEFEKLDVSAKPSIRPILGMSMDMGKLFCPTSDGCALSNWEFAFAYRGYSNTQASIDAEATIPGVVADPGLLLRIKTLDSYQPDILAFGLQYKADRWRMGLTLEQQNWSDLGDELSKDTIKDQANLRFQDITIPRLGVEYQVRDNFRLFGGVALSDSPLKSDISNEVNYLDADKTVIGLGAAIDVKNPPVFSYPVTLEFGYQHQMLDERDFRLSTNDPSNPSNPYETVRTGGDVNVFTGSLAFKF